MERRKRAAVVGLLALAAGACGGEPALAFGARVRIQSQSLGPGWHVGSVGSVGDCVVVMIPEPPVDPVRLYPIDFTDVTEVEVSDSTEQRWTRVSIEPLRSQHGGCL